MLYPHSEVTLYCNWLYNARGYPDGLILGFTQNDVINEANAIIENVLAHDKTACSFG